MQKIRKSGSLIYDRLEDVYVEPIGYEEIRETLEQYRCVFIIGSPEYGKTYTATKLLWEFYKNGIEPMYIEKESKETADACVLRKLEYQDNSLKNTIIYIEDPVGKIEYKSNKHFEESIRSITSGLGVINAYLIITMREKIYQEFKPIGKVYLEKYIKNLNIANHSYDSEKRKEILSKWATVMKCKWFQDDNLRKAVLEYIEDDETKLPTPLNIKDFAIETGVGGGNSNTIDKQKLLEVIDNISQSTPERFAGDIKEMMEHGEMDNILFLCFPFISDWFSKDFVKAEYNKLRRSFKCKKNENAFERARTKFQDKIVISGYMRFSHPSYSEALSFLLLEDGAFTEAFSKVLSKLSHNIDAARDVLNFITDNFERLA